IVFAVEPIAAVRALRRRHETDGFVIACHLHRHAGAFGRFADTVQAVAPGFGHFRFHRSPPGFQRRSVSALVTTLTLDMAIAAPATTGLRKPSAASGMPITL